MIRKMILFAPVATFLFFAAGSPALAQTSGSDPLNVAVAAMVETTSRLAFSLQQFSRAVADDTTFCSVRPATALDQASAEGSLLEDQIARVRLLLPGAGAQAAFVATEALTGAEARLSALADALRFTAPEPPGGGVVPKVTWCGGWVNCMILKTACEGCFKCYVGLTDCGCFVPCP